jgi:hypothetical protein
MRRFGIFPSLLLATLLAAGGLASAAPPADVAPEAGSVERAKTILDLQPFRRADSIRIRDTEGREGTATLVNPNPGINAWYLLRLERGPGAAAEDYHLENASRLRQKILLDPAYPGGLVLAEGKKRTPCDLWNAEPGDALKLARASNVAYAPLCEGRIYLRNPVKGYRTEIEIAAELLRDEIPGGEKIETFVRDTFFAKGYREQAMTARAPRPPAGVLPQQDRAETGPAPARLDPEQAGRVITSSHLGIDIEGGSADGSLMPGSWYPAKDSPGVYISLITAGSVAPEIVRSYPNAVSRLDTEERGALAYLVAFDLEKYEIQFSRGTDHPRVNWSDHMLDRMKDKSLPGPDGIGTAAPLVATGMIGPEDAGRTVAAFTGGFKRTHGAFLWGELAAKNRGSHYGFVENGVIFSKLQPGISTIYSLTGGRTEMGTWTEADNRFLPEIVSARQNGVPIITGFDAATAMSIPGPLVSRWGDGNWSGSIDRRLRTLRAGAALQEAGGRRFLIYAVFTGATPSSMARVFQAYRCRYAMLLDMNALELTYMALYIRKGSELYVEHLIRGMAEADKSVKGKYLPRFLSYPDNRDFFYLLRKEKR